MNKNLPLAMALCGLISPTFCQGQVSVKILDAPPRAYSFEPIWVTFEVRNEGSSPIVIPADTCNHEGAFLEVGLRGEPLHGLQTSTDCNNNRLVWLAPGDRWLFFQPVALGREGRYEVEAVLRSPGECQGELVGPKRPRLEPVRITEWGGRRYECVDGERRSGSISVEVAIPDSEVDRAAAEFLEVDSWQGNWQNSLRMTFRSLSERFPTSHYTYAAFRAAGSDLSMLNAILLQPDNPLNPWAAGAVAARLAYDNRPCATSKRPNPKAPPDLAERYAKVIAAYPPPEAVKEYIRQRELEYATEECPDGKVGKGESDE